MLEYFTYKRFKKNKAEKEKEKREADKTPVKNEAEASGSSTKPSASPAAAAVPAAAVDVLDKPEPQQTPLLHEEEQSFFERLTSGHMSLSELAGASDDEADRPALPPRVKTPDLTWDSDAESFVRGGAAGPTQGKGKGKATAPDGPSTLNATKKNAAALGRRISLMVRRPKKDAADAAAVHPTNLAVPEPEADRETDDLARVLDNLNLAAQNNRAFSLGAESGELLQKFTLVLKDLVNGVPTAVDDLKGLLDDRDGALARNFEKLPGSMKKLVTQLPTKLTGSLAPELVAAAAKSQGVAHDDASSAGLKSTAKDLLLPKNVAELVTKPSAIVGMLKAIMNALKLRWPAFIGTNVIWSVALLRT